MAEVQTIVYRPGVARRVGGHVFHAFSRVLPEPAYRTFYNTTFGAYRAGLRIAFLRHWLRAAVTGDAYGRRRSTAVHRVMPYSLVGWQGLLATYDAVHAVARRGIRGALVECGVARGGSAALLALAAQDEGEQRTLWLFDSYEGLPEPTAEDFADGRTGTHVRPLPRGSCLGTLEDVQHVLFEQMRLERERVNLVKGWFQDTLPTTASRIGAIAVLRLDGDWYESTRCCLDHLYDHVEPGGVVIIDDYGSCYGAQKAVDEFMAERSIAVDLVPDGRGGCWFFKP